MTHYTQVIARTARPTHILGAVQSADVYIFPYAPEGTVICERTSDAVDVRALVQVADGISWNLGSSTAVLALAGDESGGFWCGLFDGGERRFQHNRLIGRDDIADKPASPAEVDVLCRYFGGEVDRQAVYGVLTSARNMTAGDRHAALVDLLGLPAWSAGIGYAQVAGGATPPDAGVPERPIRSLTELGEVEASPAPMQAEDSLEWFHDLCTREFAFLEEDFRFRRKRDRNAGNHYPQMIHNVLVIGSGNQRPGYSNAYMSCYHHQHLSVVIEGLSFGARSRLCLIDARGRHLNFTRLVQQREPELLDRCRLARHQGEQIPMFARSLRRCGSDVLRGDSRQISPIEHREPGFSFSAFDSEADADYVLSLHGPPGRVRTLRARLRRAIMLRKTEARLRRRAAH